MEEGRRILVGLDLADDFTQLCCYSEAGELSSVSLSHDPLKYRIPTVLCAIRDNKDWYYGEDAAGITATDDCIKLDRLVTLAMENGSVTVFDREYPADLVLERFFRRLLNALKNKTGAAAIRGIVITVKSINANLRRNISSALELLGIRGDALRIITHLVSFMYYTVSQNRDIWINDVGLFEFDKSAFTFYRLSFGRRNTPLTIVAEGTDFSRKINYDMLQPDETDRLIYALENVSSLVLHKQIISALYFTGSGFESAWADDILKKLCNGRRVFRGQNLYVKGAGYAAKLLFDGGAENFFLVNDEVLKSSISIRVFKDGGYEEVELAHIGEECANAGAEIEVIMDRTNELDFIVHNVLKKDFVCAIVTLDTLCLRTDRTVRLNVRLSFPDRDTCVITVRDVGFGEIYKTNHKIWEQVLKI